jgi:hypothetical protein
MLASISVRSEPSGKVWYFSYALRVIGTPQLPQQLSSHAEPMQTKSSVYLGATSPVLDNQHSSGRPVHKARLINEKRTLLLWHARIGPF